MFIVLRGAYTLRCRARLTSNVRRHKLQVSFIDRKFSMPRFLALAVFALAASTASHAAGDARQLVKMPEPMVQHMLSNMRDHLLAITEIQQALGKGDYQSAADIAEKRIGLSSLGSHGASHMAPLMPKQMQDIGTQMHKAASRFSLIAQESSADGNVLRAVGALAEVTAQCVACHASYRAH
jgi:cytochrome c556